MHNFIKNKLPLSFDVHDMPDILLGFLDLGSATVMLLCKTIINKLHTKVLLIQSV